MNRVLLRGVFGLIHILIVKAVLKRKYFWVEVEFLHSKDQKKIRNLKGRVNDTSCPEQREGLRAS